jgi:hypothetical protein
MNEFCFKQLHFKVTFYAALLWQEITDTQIDAEKSGAAINQT